MMFCRVYTINRRIPNRGARKECHDIVEQALTGRDKLKPALWCRSRWEANGINLRRCTPEPSTPEGASMEVSSARCWVCVVST